jgi:hypothetical protein
MKTVDHFSDANLAACVSRASAPTARHLMPFKAVRIEVLDERGDPVMIPGKEGRAGGPAVASGFLMREQEGLYLYTCWHVVTGIDLANPVLPGALSGERRMSLRLSIQANEQRSEQVVSIGGLQTLDINLYDSSTDPRTPMWEQDEQSAKNESLSMAGLSEPFWHDVVRIRIDESLDLVDLQVLMRVDLWHGLVAPGDSLLIVGYPYGYSALKQNPTPIVVKRSVAATRTEGVRQEVLIDGGGAPGMCFNVPQGLQQRP